MNMTSTKAQSAHNPQIFSQTYGDTQKQPIFYGHGWGQSHKSFEPLIQSLEPLGHHISLDFPGFGQSPLPGDVWGSKDYADHIAALIKEQTNQPIIWVGHSFGCRVGLNLAIHHPELIAGLCLIGGAGLRRKRPLMQAVWLNARIYTFKALKKLTPLTAAFGVTEDWLKSKFGSADYKAAGPIRPIMVKVSQEDLTAEAPAVKCPTLLIYGEQDSETPPEIGQRLAKLIPDAALHILPAQDHYTVLNEGRHQVAPLLKNFIQKLSH